MIGLLLDEMYPPALARQLREYGHDVVAALDVEVGLSSRSDDDVLTWAARNDRCVVTENVRDFARLAAMMPHAGIIFVSAQRFPRTRNGLVRLGTALDGLLAEKRMPPPDGVVWLNVASPVQPQFATYSGTSQPSVQAGPHQWTVTSP